MTWRIVAALFAGGVFGLIVGCVWGWAARTQNITKHGYTMFSVSDNLYIVRTVGMAEALESMNAKMDSHELREMESEP